MIKIRIKSAGQCGARGRVEKFIHNFGKKTYRKDPIWVGGVILKFMDWILVVSDRDQWRVVSTIMNRGSSKTVGAFLDKAHASC